MPAPRRCIFHIDMDAFFPSVEEILNPRLQGKPVIVGGPRDARGVVSSASYPARKFGVKSGMALKVAAKLCPQGIFIPGHHHLYSDIAHHIFAIFRDFTPDVEPVSIDEAYLDLTGFDNLYGPPAQTAPKIKKAVFAETGLTCSIGTSVNKTIAKIASDFLKPNGITEVKPGFEKNFLFPLDIAKMPGIGPVAQKTLRREGINTLGDLAQSSPGFLERILGKWGTDLYHRANGFDPSPVAARSPSETKSVSRENTFPKDTNDLPKIKATLLYLLEKTLSSLRKINKRAWTLTLRLRYPDFRTVQKSVRLPRPSQTASEISQVLFKLFRQTVKIPTRLRLVGVKLSDLTDDRPQLSFFEKYNRENLGRSVDEIRKRFGFGAILPAEILNLGKKNQGHPF